MRLGKDFSTKNKFRPVSDLDPNPGFGSGPKSGFQFGFDSEFEYGSRFEFGSEILPSGLDPIPLCKAERRSHEAE